MQTQTLAGKIAIVTGAGRGLGATTALLFAQHGATVVLSARTANEVIELADRIIRDGGRALAIPADVSSHDDARAIVQGTLDAFGRIDILVNNAAVAHPYQRIEEVDPQAWVDAVNINLIGSFWLARHALPHLLAQDSGRIINVSSGLALNTRVGQSAYCVSKAGLEMLMRGLALETAGTGVVITSYDPGMIDTPMQAEQRVLDAAALRVDTAMFHAAHREGRFRDPAYVSNGLLWLAGPLGSDKNGQRFSINDEKFRQTIAEDLSV